MNRNAAGVEPHLKVVARPSLYTTDTPQNAAEKQVSILASLEPERPAKKISRAWLLSISITLLIIGFMYWAYVNSIFRQPLVMPAWIETALNISKAPIPVVSPNVQPVAAKLDRPIVVAVEESHPATIVTESTPPVVSMDSATSKSETTDKPAKLDPELAKKKSGEQQPAVLAVAAKPVTSQKVEANESAPHKNTVVTKADSKVLDTTNTNKQAKTDGARNTKDEDVDLIAALLSRVSHQDASGKEVKHKKSSASTSSSASSVSAKQQNKVDPKRDIVTRADGDTTESLLKRCKALGFFEGELCRVRICSSLWGKDPACPAPEQVAMPNIN